MSKPVAIQKRAEVEVKEEESALSLSVSPGQQSVLEVGRLPIASISPTEEDEAPIRERAASVDLAEREALAVPKKKKKRRTHQTLKKPSSKPRPTTPDMTAGRRKSASHVAVGKQSIVSSAEDIATAGTGIRMRVVRPYNDFVEGHTPVRPDDIIDFCGLNEHNVEALVLPNREPAVIPLDFLELMPFEGNQTAEQRHALLQIALKLKEVNTLNEEKGKSKRKASKARAALNKGLKDLKNNAEQSLARRSQRRKAEAARELAIKIMSEVGEDDEYNDEVLDPDSLQGVSLEDLYTQHPNLDLPPPFEKCIEWFRSSPDNMKHTGIFRVPGSSNGIIRLQNKFLLHEDAGVSVTIDPEEHQNVVASTLKQYLHDLPEPIIPRSQWYWLMEITEERDFNMKDAVTLLKKLTKLQKKILGFLCKFMAEVATYHAENMMKIPNLGMVFGITVMKSPDDQSSNLSSSMPKEVLTFLVENHGSLFSVPRGKSDSTLDVPGRQERKSSRRRQPQHSVARRRRKQRPSIIVEPDSSTDSSTE